MPNLLPEKNKKQILREFIMRLLVVFLIFLFFTVGVAGSALIPSYVLSLVKESVVKDENQKFDKDTESPQEENSPTALLEQERRKIETLSEFTENNVIDVISSIIEKKPESIKINGFFYDREDKEEGEEIILIVRGVATDRNILVGFIETLERENNFAEVDFPVSNLLQGESVDFSVKISIK